MKKEYLFLIVLIISSLKISAQDSNFHIYLSFGQSNMEGTGDIEEIDKEVDDRFLVLQTIDCPSLGREKARWYQAIPPLCQCSSGLSPVDYFGRTMVSNLPDSIRVGVINVAVAGCDIRLFDKDLYQGYDSTYVADWFLDKISDYHGNPYQYLVDMAEVAKGGGIIKGILLHQGETNTDDEAWPLYVAKIYNDLLSDLALNAEDVPLIAGELVSTEGSCCGSMNSIINTLPNVINTAHVVSSKACTAQDNAHFDSEGYREMGRRYGITMLGLLDLD